MGMEPTQGETVPTGLLARAQGCLLGQVAGDALGAMVEFASASEMAARYPDGPREIGPSPVWRTLAGQPTDDSELALTLARTLLAYQAFDAEAIARAYVAWLESQPFDVGGTTHQALSAMARAQREGGSLVAAAHERANQQSEANGALMRQSPLAIWGHTLPAEELDALIRADTRLTHPNRVCQDASTALIVPLAAIIHVGQSAEDAYALALAWDADHGASPGVSQALARASEAPPANLSSSAGHVLLALQNAWYQALHAPSLEEGVVATVMGGGDTDTNAAIAGALLGALHGADAIPQQWRAAVLNCRAQVGAPGVRQPRPPAYWPTDAIRLAERLAAEGAALHG